MADGFIYTQPAYDAAEFLPAPAADRLGALRQRVSDKNALTVPFERRHAAGIEKVECEARLKRLQEHRSSGGFGLASDDPSVVIEKKRLAALTAEAQRLNDLDTTRSTQWREAGYALANIEAWLRHGMPPGTALEVCKTAAPPLPKGQSLTDAIEARERRIRELQAAARKVEASPFPAAYAREKMRKQISELAERGKPDVSRLLKYDRDVEFAEASHSVPVMGRTDAGIAGWQEPDAFLLTVFLNRQALVKELDAAISAESDDGHAMTAEQKEKATATIMSDMLACDRELSELIWLAQAQNLPVEFRPDASPLAVLGLALVTAPRAAPSGTTAGRAYSIIGSR